MALSFVWGRVQPRLGSTRLPLDANAGWFTDATRNGGATTGTLGTGFYNKRHEIFRFGHVYIYEAGTTRMVVSYRTPDMRDDFGTVNTNPVELDANGRAHIYLRPGDYDVVVDGVTVRISAPASPTETRTE